MKGKQTTSTEPGDKKDEELGNKRLLNQLRKAYYSPETGFVSAKALFERLQGKIKGLTLDQVRAFIKRQPTFQEFKQPKKDAVQNITVGPPGSYQADLTFYENLKRSNEGVIGLLTMIERTSRKAFVEPIKNKTAAEVLDALERIVDRLGDTPMEYLSVDNGTEFLNSRTRSYLKKKDVDLKVNQAGDHKAQSMIESFNRTIRGLITRYLETNETSKFVDVLEKLVENYNSKPHKTLSKLTGQPTAPNDITNEVAEAIRAELALKQAEYRNKVMRFEPGDKVRHKLKYGLFKKLGRTWSTNIMTVEEQVGFKYRISGTKRLYRPDELQKVDEVDDKPEQPEIVEPKKTVAKSKAEAKQERKLKAEDIKIENIVGTKRERKAPKRYEQ